MTTTRYKLLKDYYVDVSNVKLADFQPLEGTATLINEDLENWLHTEIDFLFSQSDPFEDEVNLCLYTDTSVIIKIRTEDGIDFYSALRNPEEFPS